MNIEAIDEALKNISEFFGKAKQGVKLSNLTDNQGYAAKAILNAIQNDDQSYTAMIYICRDPKSYFDDQSEKYIAEDLQNLLSNFDYNTKDVEKIYEALQNENSIKAIVSELKSKWKAQDVKPVTEEAYAECVEDLSEDNDDLKQELFNIYEENVPECSMPALLIILRAIFSGYDGMSVKEFFKPFNQYVKHYAFYDNVYKNVKKRIEPFIGEDSILDIL